MPRLGFLLALVAAAALPGQTVWTTPGIGLYNYTGDWSNGVPNSGTSAEILNGTLATPTTAELTGSGSVLNLTLAAHNTLALELGSTLTVYGTSIDNAGVITVTAGSATNTSLVLQNSLTLSGAGTVQINYGDHNGNAVIEEGTGSSTLTNSGNTIEGDGIIGNGGLTLVNGAGGTIEANISAQTLTLNGTGGITNAGTLLASSAGILQISSPVANAGGTILASGGTVALSTTVTGGTLTSTGAGVLESNGTAGLDNVTLTTGSTYNGPLGSTTTLAGNISNQGTIQLDGGFATNSRLELTSNATLMGGGVVTLDSGDDNGQAFIEEIAASLTLTNADNLIQGYGDIGASGLTIINQAGGTFDANISAQTLTLDGLGGVTNLGLLEANAGGILHLATVVDNYTGTITANGGTVNLSSTVQGGTLNSINSGTLETSGTALLDGSTEGTITVSAGSTYVGPLNSTTNMEGAVIIAGAVQLNGGYATNTSLSLVGDTTLEGGGTVTLNSGDNNGSAFIQQSGGNYTLTNLLTIQGYGVVGNGPLTVYNGGTGVINANVSGQTLTINPTGGFTNAGTLEASGGGILALSGSTLNNNGGTIEVSGATSVMDFVNDAVIEGGTLTTTSGGTLGVPGTTITLDGATEGPITLSTGSVYSGALNTSTYLLGTIVNRGTFDLAGGYSTNTELIIGGNVTLEGAGTITMNSGDNNGHVFIEEASTGLTLTNVDNLIQGYGIIGNSAMALLNEASGIVDANSSAGVLILNGSGNIQNSGLLEATNSGTLSIQNTVTNTSANVTANNGTVVISGTIVGGTLNSLNGGTLGDGGGAATLDGRGQAITLSAGSTWEAGLNSQTTLLGTIVNQGTFQLTAGSATNNDLRIGSNVTLQGGGTVTLNSGDNNGQVYVEETGGSFSLSNVDNLIQGYGVIGNGGLIFVNSVGGVVDANSPLGALLLNGGGNVQNSGLLEATNGGNLTITNTVTNTSARISANNGTVLVNGTIAGGTLSSLNGGSLGDGGGSATLDGSSQALTLSTGSIWVAGPGSTTTLLGTINNQGIISVLGGSARNTYLVVSGNVTLQGAGTVTLNSSDDNGFAYIQASGPTALSDQNNLIQGYGIIGNGALALNLGATAEVNANIDGQTLRLNGSGGVANSGTLEASGGGTLEIDNIVTNLGLVIANGGTVNIAGGTVEGGILSGTGLETATSATLDGMSHGTLTLASGSTFTAGLGSSTLLLGTISNQGTLQVVGGYATNTYLSLSADVTLQGGGTIALNSGDDNGQAYLQEASAGLTLTNVDNLIEGYGAIGNGALSLINEAAGVIEAAGAGQTLAINTSGLVSNIGTFEANDAVLSIANDPSNLAANTLSGGTWEAVNGGTIAFSSPDNAIVTNNAVLILNGPSSEILTKTGGDGDYQTVEQTLTTNEGTLEVIGARDFAATNPITNNGVIQLGGGILSTPSLTNSPGSSLTGYGTVAPTAGTVIASGAILSPGSVAAAQQIATLNFSTGLTLGPSGVMVFSLQNASGVAGVDYDTLTVTGTLTLNATPGSPFAIQLVSINPGTGSAGLASFNSGQPYSWTLATAGSITGFNPAAFSFNSSGFQNSLNGGYFQVAKAGSVLALDFVPVPEPSTWAMLLGGTGLLGFAVHRRRRAPTAGAKGEARP